ncbi:hypothetical protein BU16DRAFT_253623 [Lophium mytilinum]|uniref:Zn(2)-C6 fungal-type domain-containing protein n=1 Tax=Lophium mytilinum TaxID=390894 RepID=A0A6A6R7T2_9PEZI|nr:hypothetical protein BU16DRAFT_253623 [Lophium mytilinum]
MAADLKACSGCAKAKRKCGRQTPACQRCRDRGFDCVYPPPKPSYFVLSEAPTSPLADTFTGDRTSLSGLTTAEFLNGEINVASPPEPADLSVHFPHCSTTWSSVAWFLSPETWEIDRYPVTLTTAPCNGVLKRHIRSTQAWLEQWIATGSNPFIHSHLYATRFPSCIQVAYTTLSAYLNRTEANTETILRIVEDRTNELLLENGVTFGDLGQENNTASPQLEVLDHLARIHALFVYHTISLFDGDIRSRSLAEPRCHVLNRWVSQMVDCARHSLSQLSFAFSPLDLTQGSLPAPYPTSTTENLWHTWILSESVRRTWMTVTGMYAVYHALQQGWTLCPGGIMFTNSQGVWQAETASAWEKICLEGVVMFMQRFEAERLFSEASPSDVDEFGKRMMEITFGIKKVESWKE